MLRSQWKPGRHWMTKPTQGRGDDDDDDDDDDADAVAASLADDAAASVKSRRYDFVYAI